MLPYHITRKKIKKKLQIIQNKAPKSIFNVNRNSRLKNLINYLTRSTTTDEDTKEIVISHNNSSIKSIQKSLN